VIASAVCEPLTLSGLQVPQVPGLGSEQDVLARLRTMPGRPRPWYWEPRWHDAVDASRAARFLSLGNASQIVGALGSSPSPADDVNTVRNFVAHRNQGTAGKLQPLLARHSLVPTPGTSSRMIIDNLISKPAGPATVFHEWCTQIELIAIASVA
jgi:hypothetical protein